MTAQRGGGDFGRLPVNAGDVRERLAAALVDRREVTAELLSKASPQTWARKSETAKDIHRACASRLFDELADALLPTVDALIREGAAEALEQAADSLGDEEDQAAVLAQAAALRAASHTEATR